MRFITPTDDAIKGTWELACGTFAAIIGYFIPIRDMAHFIVLLFIVDVFLGYIAARKLRGEPFRTKIVWQTTMPRMSLSLLLLILAFMWDKVYSQDYVQTYTIIGWFISGIIFWSIAKNMFKITKWEVFESLAGMIKGKIQDKTGMDLNNGINEREQL